jgi:hypothetical protein
MVSGKHLRNHGVKVFQTFAAILLVAGALHARDAVAQFREVELGPAGANPPTIGVPSAKRAEVPFVG